MNSKILIFVLFSVLAVNIAISQVPEPHNVEGRVFYPDGNGVDNGIPIRIVDLNNSQETETEVDAPNIPEFRGSYSATINATTGDTIRVRSWNDTHYGESFAAVLETTTEVNVTLNITRDPEANVTILIPANNTSYEIGDVFNITANITILGAAGSSCVAEVRFGNPSVISTTGSAANSLGSLNLGETIVTSFEAQAIGDGVTNVTVNASCQESSVNLEREDSDTVFNLSASDETPPTVSLITPSNNTEKKASNDITFAYNVSDASDVNNCSLLLNQEVNQTDNTIQKDTEQNFTQDLSNGQYDWSVTCTDIYGNTGSSGTFNLSLSVFPPNITRISMASPITLSAGTQTQVACDFTVEDGNGASDITGSNATFFHSTSSAGSQDDKNVHYTNTSCAETATSESQKNYTCSFEIEYYAVNGTWTCNATAIDQQGLAGSNSTSTTIEPLFALNTSTSIIDYEGASINQTSPEVLVNITNIGNQPIDVSVWGYGGSDIESGDGLAMVCPRNNISIEHERYSLDSSPYSSKTSLSSNPQQTGLTLPKQEGPSRNQNTTYWQMFVPELDPPIGRGICNGTVIFQAESS